jgi:hypothetical protein
LITGFIVNKADSWDDLGIEFEQGKEAQLNPIVSEESIKENDNVGGTDMTESMKDNVKYLDL